MRGADERCGSLFSYIDLESRIPEVHPLRAIRVIVNTALADLNAEFEAMYAPIGRPSIPPEKLLRSSLLVYTALSSKFDTLNLKVAWTCNPRGRPGSGARVIRLLQ